MMIETCENISKYGIKIKLHHHVHEYFPMVCLESQRLHHCYMCTPPHSLHRLYPPIFHLPTNLCVFHIVCIYIYSPTLARRPPPSPQTHTKGVLFVYSRTHRLKKTRKDSNKERETKRDREEVFGGGSLELGSGWWSGLHLQVLEVCLPRSLPTCLDTCNNGMFQEQRSRDNQPYAPMRAHVRMETCLPRAHLFICLVYYHNAVYNHTSLFV